MKLWIVGKYTNIKEGTVWEFGGVFSDEQKAIDACTNHSMFIGPAILDHRVPDESVNWKGLWYSLLEEKPND